MAFVARSRVSSEDEKKSTVEIKGGVNLAIVFMEPATVMEQFGEPQDTVRWRLSAEVKIGLQPNDAADQQTYAFSFATLLLPPLHHARQAVAVWYWPIAPTALDAGRPLGVTFRWESDRARATADVLVLAMDSPSGPQAGLCGLFGLPFPASMDVFKGFPGAMELAR